MLESCILIMILYVVSGIINEKFKIPSTITLIVFAIIENLLSHNFMIITDKGFDEILLLTLPLFIAYDSLHLTFDELKDNFFSLMFTACISVIISVFIVVLIGELMLPEYNISAAGLVLLGCMVLATDPITVSSIFSNFKLPHKLKILAEGEGLFNDAFVLIMFFFALNLLNGAEFSAVSLATFSFKMIILSTILGIVVAYCFMAITKRTKNIYIATIMFLLPAYISFAIAEHFHIAGILAVISSVITSRVLFERGHNIYLKSDAEKQKSFILENEPHILSKIKFLTEIAGVFLFFSIGKLINMDMMMKYWSEILVVFCATTLIRVMMVSKFTWLSNKTIEMKDIPFHWWKVISLSGVKGGLSILMVHLIPDNYEHKELFEAIVLGNIILSTFVYALLLSIFIRKDKDKFEKEYLEEKNIKHGI